MKLVELSRRSIGLLKENGDEGLRSDVLAEMLGTPKRRVYDVVAVLKAIGLVSTRRRFDGTTVTWIDPTKDYVHRSEHDQVKVLLREVDEDRKRLQVELAEAREELRQARLRVRQDTPPVASSQRVDFSTTQLRVRCLGAAGFKRVRDSGMEVLIESSEPGIAVDPTEVEPDENEALIRSVQRL